jgi:hypothetical protein
MSLRKLMGHRGAFPNDHALIKLFYLAVEHAQTQCASGARPVAALDVPVDSTSPHMRQGPLAIAFTNRKNQLSEGAT